MRRCIPLLFLFAFGVLAQTAQGIRPDTPQPIPLQIEMPPESPWNAAIKVALPTLLGAGLTLFGVWLTTKRNAAENEANRKNLLALEVEKAKIAAEQKSRDNQWEFRKTVFVNLLNSIERILALLQGTGVTALDQAALRDFVIAWNSEMQQLSMAQNLAPLALSDEVLSLVEAAKNVVTSGDVTDVTHFRRVLTVFQDLQKQVQRLGRQDLWGKRGVQTAASTSA